MSIKPKIQVHFKLASEGQNPDYVTVYVANEGARTIVNSFKDELFLKRGSFLSSDDNSLIREGTLEGWFVVNPCYDRDEVVQLITEAVGQRG